MARRKKKDKKGDKPKDTKNSSAPEGFSRQATAFILGAVIAPLLILAMFGLGGSLPVRLFDSAKWLTGFTAYLAPLILIYAAIKIFRSQEHKLPRSVFWGLILFLTSVSGLAHLAVDRADSLSTADKGQAGGMLGHLTDSALFPLLDMLGTSMVLLAVGLLSLLFILRIPIKSFLGLFINSFRDKGADDETDKPKPDKKFQLNEGVPIEKGAGSGDVLQPSSSDTHEALTTISDPEWELPGLELLINKQDEANPGDVTANADIIKDTLTEFNIPVEMEGANVGPRVTQYTLKPPPAVRLSKIVSLDNNLALNLAAEAIRIEAPIPGQRAVGIEVPNVKPASVRIYDIISDPQWKEDNSNLVFALGKDISGKTVLADLDTMPHLLVAGTTGSGKSVMINTILTSLLFKNSPSTLKLILIDPKLVELKPYDDIPHLLTPVINGPEKTLSALKWCINEMERRLKILSDVNRRDISEYNRLKQEETMPYIVIVIDELSDLMAAASRDLENSIVRLAQKSRAVGIHLILATQRPDANVITGLIKANVPSRIAFRTNDQINSRVIIDQMGAEKLLGKGDMLYKAANMAKAVRLQAALSEIGEVEKVADFVRMQRAPEYDDEVVSQPVHIGGGGYGISSDDVDDTLYDDAVRMVIDTGKASTSFLQRRFSIGYTRAARLIDMMEENGVVAQAHGNKPRDVLVTSHEEAFEKDGDNSQSQDSV